MKDRKPLTNLEGQVRELDEQDLTEAIPFSALPETLKQKLSNSSPELVLTVKAQTTSLHPMELS